MANNAFREYLAEANRRLRETEAAFSERLAAAEGAIQPRRAALFLERERELREHEERMRLIDERIMLLEAETKSVKDALIAEKKNLMMPALNELKLLHDQLLNDLNAVDTTGPLNETEIPHNNNNNNKRTEERENSGNATTAVASSSSSSSSASALEPFIEKKKRRRGRPRATEIVEDDVEEEERDGTRDGTSSRGATTTTTTRSASTSDPLLFDHNYNLKKRTRLDSERESRHLADSQVVENAAAPVQSSTSKTIPASAHHSGNDTTANGMSYTTLDGIVERCIREGVAKGSIPKARGKELESLHHRNKIETSSSSTSSDVIPFAMVDRMPSVGRKPRCRLCDALLPDKYYSGCIESTMETRRGERCVTHKFCEFCGKYMHQRFEGKCPRGVFDGPCKCKSEA